MMLVAKPKVLFVLSPAIFGLSLAQSTRKQPSQNISVNNGITVQVNVRHELEKAAKLNDIDERGWMRVLIPGHEPESSRDSLCSLPPSAAQWLAIDLGTNVVLCNSLACNLVGATFNAQIADHGDLLLARPPTASIAVVPIPPAGARLAVYPLISVKQVKGAYLLSAEVFDEDGNIRASLRDNTPHVNRRFVSDWSRPDPSSLKVIDNKNEVVLDIRLENQHRISVKGRFYIPERLITEGMSQRSVLIEEGDIKLSKGPRISGGCYIVRHDPDVILAF